MLTKYTWLVFDLDNTLLDYGHSEHIALAHIYSRFFYNSKFEFQRFKQCYQTINNQLWSDYELNRIIDKNIHLIRFQRLIARLAHDDTYNEIANTDASVVADEYASAFCVATQWIQDTQAVLTQLKSNYCLAILSNGSTSMQLKRFQQASMSNWFDKNYVFISETLGAAKPAHEAFHMTLDRLDCKPTQALMIGDSLYSDAGCLQVGMDFCWINSHHPSASPSPFGEPTWMCRHLRELPKQLGIAC